MEQASSLSGCSVLITGAAGRLGSEAAIQSFSAGAKVILTDIDEEPLSRLNKYLVDIDSERVYCIAEDLSSDEGLDILCRKINSMVGFLDGAVHCAYPRSDGWGKPFEDLIAANLFSDLNNQLGGAILLSKKILNLFQQ